MSRQTTAIVTKPHYVGVFLEPASRRLLRERIRPRHNLIYANKIIIRYDPDGQFNNVKWGAEVSFSPLRHIIGKDGHALQLKPVSMTFDNDKIETNSDEINKLLGKNDDEAYYAVTLSLGDRESQLSYKNLNKMLPLTDEQLTEQGYEVIDVSTSKEDVIIKGIVGLKANVRVRQYNPKKNYRGRRRY